MIFFILIPKVKYNLLIKSFLQVFLTGIKKILHKTTLNFYERLNINSLCNCQLDINKKNNDFSLVIT